MLLLDFEAALQRCELALLRLRDVQTVPGRGLWMRVRRSQTNQHGLRQEVAVWANPEESGFCAAAALHAWLRVGQGASALADRAASDAERPLSWP